MPDHHTPLVSIILPFLDGPEWLCEAIESVIAQTYTNWELILIDDGSAKEASEVAVRFAKLYAHKVFYCEHPAHANKGVSVSRNTGVSLARGEFIAFLDSDDKWLPMKLKRQVDIFRLNPAAAVLCEASMFWYSWNDSLSPDEIVYVGATGGKIYEPGELISLLYPFGTGAPPCPTGIIMRKSAFERVGGFEPAFAAPNQLYEDQALLVKLYLREHVYISAQANNMYRKRIGSLTGAGADEQHYTRVRRFFFDWFVKKFPSSPYQKIIPPV